MRTDAGGDAVGLAKSGLWLDKIDEAAALLC